MVLRQILQLHDAASPASGTIGTVELEHPTDPAVIAYSVFHRLVFFDRAFGKLLTKGKYLGKALRGIFHEFCHSLFAEGLSLHSVLSKPGFHLDDTVWIFQIGHVLHLGGDGSLGALVKGDGVGYQLHIHANASVVDFLVQVILVPQEFRHREVLQFFLDGELDFNISFIVGNEGGPFLWSMLWQITGTASVAFCRFTGYAEVADQVRAFRHFLLVQLKNGTDAFEGKWQPHYRTPDKGAAPG